MVTVAMKVDAPVKLIIQTGSKSNIIGLGDIVVPGIMVALALRFDLWMHYQRKTRYEPLYSPYESHAPGTDMVLKGRDLGVRRHVAKRAAYVNVSGNWGEWFWTQALSRRKLGSNGEPTEIFPTYFPKPYFYASISGYGFGLLCTMTMLIVFKHGQPALLYLVPSLIGTLLITGLVRGEIREMMLYNEDGSLDVEDAEVELDESGRLLRFIISQQREEEARHQDHSQKNPFSSVSKAECSSKAEDRGVCHANQDQTDVFLLRISGPVAEAAEYRTYNPHED